MSRARKKKEEMLRPRCVGTSLIAGMPDTVWASKIHGRSRYRTRGFALLEQSLGRENEEDPELPYQLREELL
jgi:hypothetical protein